MPPEIRSKSVRIEDLDIHYLSAGQGEPILFIHGFPTSAYLWRNVIAGLAGEYQAIAIDLPGYGQSSKDPAASYSFRFFNRILNAFLEKLGLEQITLGVHDFGGPVGLYWMVQNMEKVNRLILFNTLVYPDFSPAVKLFGLATVVPGVRHWLVSPAGIRFAMRFGVYQKERLSKEIIHQYQAPFPDQSSRKALLKSVQRLSLKGFAEIERKLPDFGGPVQILYGEKDKILPRVARTMARIKEDLPQSIITSFPDCGHFLQEEIPEKLSDNVLRFMKA